ncbi:hypothetical protein NDU88_001371 [Pleurodeles waltl]|uniref:Uncharacterized protein n=1 Tax=Pleurodeles waltl TaxID=8319 RepID=A0AAV7L9K9_PLEWA|nr:hypothetical protein NDU88_001371 [Pleurodeles waltl]
MLAPAEAAGGIRQWKEGPRGPLKADKLTEETQWLWPVPASYEHVACCALVGALPWRWLVPRLRHTSLGDAGIVECGDQVDFHDIRGDDETSSSPLGYFA